MRCSLVLIRTALISYNKSIDENEYQNGECTILNSCILFYYYFITLNRKQTNFCLTLRNEWVSYWLKNMSTVPIYVLLFGKSWTYKMCTTSHLKSGIKLNRAHRVIRPGRWRMEQNQRCTDQYHSNRQHSQWLICLPSLSCNFPLAIHTILCWNNHVQSSPSHQRLWHRLSCTGSNRTDRLSRPHSCFHSNRRNNISGTKLQ